MKAVLDTNVLVAAFVSEGLCRRLLLRARDGRFTLAIAPFIRDEFARVLRRKAAADAGEIREALELIDEISTSVDPTARESGVKGICRDPDDDHRPGLRRSPQARIISSAETKDLHILNRCRGVRIIAPRTFELLFKD